LICFTSTIGGSVSQHACKRTALAAAGAADDDGKDGEEGLKRRILFFTFFTSQI
jgi:hypothetical protein